MPTVQRVLKNFYRDSVALMQFSKGLSEQSGVQQASAVMATENNLDLLREAGLSTDSVEGSPNDLLIVLQGEVGSALEKILDEALASLTRRSTDSGDGSGPRRTPPRSIEMALNVLPDANFALISTPGDYAASEALKALHHGLHVMLFSDNVSLADEIVLKQYAREHGLLVMGPDCGTAIINGIPLGFANVVRRGSIGVIGASGTGTQQVTCLIDRWGSGVSQAIGLGSHDLHVQVGGISMLTALEALAIDSTTDVIVLISKPPAPEVAARVLEKAAQISKPVVVDFLGADPATVEREGVMAASTLEEAAAIAVALSHGQPRPTQGWPLSDEQVQLAPKLAAQFQPGQRYVRGLFSGGTFCFESLLLLGEALGSIHSNIPLKPEHRLANVWQSQAHTAIDLGDDAFTQGRPHPMIDFRLRNERIVKEAADPEVAVILLDVVLGYGSNLDPAGELVPAIREARAAAGSREVNFIASVCGTESDPQNLARQENTLRAAGAWLTESNAQAARLAGAIVSERNH
ncbi:MAG: acyl-CoA synthetase FdrA [Anaerolineales bacterium]